MKRGADGPVRRAHFSRRLLLVFFVVTITPMLIACWLFYTTTVNQKREQIHTNMRTGSEIVISVLQDRLSSYETLLESLVYDDETLADFYLNPDDRSGSTQRIEALFSSLSKVLYSMGGQVRSIRVAMEGLSSGLFDCGRYLYYQARPTAFYTADTFWFLQDSSLVLKKRLINPYSRRELATVYLELDREAFFADYFQLDFERCAVFLVNDYQMLYRLNTLSPDEDIPDESVTQLPRGGESAAYNGRSYELLTQAIVRPPDGEGDWVLYMLVPESFSRSQAAVVLRLTAMLIIACIGASLLLATVLSRSLSRRIVRLKQQMIGAQKNQYRVEVLDGPKDEIYELSVVFKDLLDNIDFLVNTVLQNEINMKKSTLKMLQAQINPHFLYNCLNIISVRSIMNEDETTSSVAGKIADFYRTVLNKGQDTISIADELLNVESYLDLQLLLHNHSFQVYYAVEPACKAYSIINLTLQPIVENAIEHGIDASPGRTGVITLSAWMAGDNVCFHITNTGPPISEEVARTILQEDKGGYGLYNVNERLRITYGDYTFSIFPYDGHTHVFIRIPAVLH